MKQTARIMCGDARMRGRCTVSERYQAQTRRRRGIWIGQRDSVQIRADVCVDKTTARRWGDRGFALIDAHRKGQSQLTFSGQHKFSTDATSAAPETPPQS